MNGNELNKVLSENLKTFRQIKGISLNKAAREIGIVPSYLCALENPDIVKNVTLEMMARLSNYYEVDPYLLFKE